MVELESKLSFGIARLLIIEGVFDGDRDLITDLAEHLYVVLRKRVLASGRHAQHAQLTAVRSERNTSARIKPCLERLSGVVRIKPFEVGFTDEDRPASSECQPTCGSL